MWPFSCAQYSCFRSIIRHFFEQLTPPSSLVIYTTLCLPLVFYIRRYPGLAGYLFFTVFKLQTVCHRELLRCIEQPFTLTMPKGIPYNRPCLMVLTLHHNSSVRGKDTKVLQQYSQK